MCGRYVIFTDDQEMNEIMEEIDQKYSGTEYKSGEIFPTNIVPVLSMEQSSLSPRLVKWGFSRWNGGGAVINARAETAMEKNMFRKSLFERRCVIPSSGFYEWQRVDGRKKKDKYLFQLPHESALYMAGMTNMFKDQNGGQYEAFVILTTAANQSISDVHDRMPLILSKEILGDWISDTNFALDYLRTTPPMLERLQA